MKIRTFKVFITDKGVNEIENWLQSVPKKFRARVERFIFYLETQQDMRCKYFKSYKGYNNIYELRFTNNTIEHRPLGCFGPMDNEFTILLHAVEKDGKLEPRNSPETAVKRCALIHQDRRYINDFA